MAGFGDGLKVISYAINDISREAFDNLMDEHNAESDEFRNEIESKLVYLCTFGL